MQIDTEIRIHGSSQDVFDVLLALDRYGEWLPASDVHKGIEVEGAGPVGVGTTYVDRQAGGAHMSGHVRICDPPNSVGFTQTVRLPFGLFEARVDFEITSDGESTTVVRHQVASLPWLLRPLQPIARLKGRSESERVLRALKRHVEGRVAGG